MPIFDTTNPWLRSTVMADTLRRLPRFDFQPPPPRPFMPAGPPATIPNMAGPGGFWPSVPVSAQADPAAFLQGNAANYAASRINWGAAPAASPDSAYYVRVNPFIPRVAHDSQSLMAQYPEFRPALDEGAVPSWPGQLPLLQRQALQARHQWPGLNGPEVTGGDARNAGLYRRDHSWSYPDTIPNPSGTFAFPEYYGVTGGDARGATLIGPPRPQYDSQDARNYVKPNREDWADAGGYTPPGGAPPKRPTNPLVAAVSKLASGGGSTERPLVPNSMLDYSNWSDQAVRDAYEKMIGESFFNGYDRRLDAEYKARWGSKIKPSNPLYSVIKYVDDTTGARIRGRWNDILNLGNILGNNPYRQTYNGGELPNGQIYTGQQKPRDEVAAADNKTNATKNTSAGGANGGRAGAATGAGAAATGPGGVGAPSGTYDNTFIDSAFAQIDKNMAAIQAEDEKRRAKYEGEANTAWDAMQQSANAPPPEIDSKNQMFTMLAANIAKVLNPNLDSQGQASQLMQTKLQGMRDQNLRHYQMLAEKYRRASELFDKSGDQARAVQYARSSDLAIKRAESLMNESHFQQQLQEQRAERAADRSERSQERMWNRSMERSKTDLSTLNSLAERLQNLVNNTKEEKERNGYRTRLTRVVRTMQHMSNNQLAAFNNPDGVQPLDPDSLFAEMFTQIDADKFPKSRKDMLRLFKHDKNFKEAALRDQWGFTQNEVMDYYDRRYGGGAK